MRKSILTALILLLPAWAAPARAAQGPLTCRAQVVAICDTACDFGGAAVLTFDFGKGELDYCRGERCDTVKIAVTDQIGEWDHLHYLVFTGSAENGGVVKGIVSSSADTFSADGDAGAMFGTCSVD